MAGIGFELRKLLARDNLLALLRAYAYAGVISSGPWILSILGMLLIGIFSQFWAVIALISVWGLMFAASMPIRQSYMNGMIPSNQRATILSFDSMLGSSGGVVIQPVLGRAADTYSYATSYMFGAAFTTMALPFIWLSRRQKRGATRPRSRGPRNSAPSAP